MAHELSAIHKAITDALNDGADDADDAALIRLQGGISAAEFVELATAMLATVQDFERRVAALEKTIAELTQRS